MHAKRYAASVILDRYGTVTMQSHLDFFAKPGQRFIGRVVEHLLDDVQGVVGPGIHAGALFDRLQPLEHTDRTFGIRGIRFDRHRGIVGPERLFTVHNISLLPFGPGMNAHVACPQESGAPALH